MRSVSLASCLLTLASACAPRLATGEADRQHTVATVVVPAAPASASTTVDPGSGEVGTVEGARKRLAEFTQPGADTAKLTAALKPSVADLGSIFDQSVLATMQAHVDQSYRVARNGLEFKDLREVLCFASDDLRSWTPEVRQSMPGGYQRLAPTIRSGLTFCRFKAGGLSYDALVFVRRHWVFVPKPFRAVKGGSVRLEGAAAPEDAVPAPAP